MGWATGVNVLSDMWEAIEDLIPDNKQPLILSKMIQVIEQYDCDNTDELQYNSVIHKEALRILHPNLYPNEKPWNPVIDDDDDD